MVRDNEQSLLLIFFKMCIRDRDGTIQIPFNRNAWAEFLCVDRSALSRELGRLKNEGILVCEGNRVILMDKGFLSPS